MTEQPPEPRSHRLRRGRAVPHGGVSRRAGALVAALILGASPGAARGDTTGMAANGRRAEGSAEERAGARLDEGIRLYRLEQFDMALAEFLEARRLHPFRNALFNAALCLEKLGRPDEALEQLETFLGELDEGSPADARDRERAERKIIEVSRNVGTIQIEAAEPGATISIDGRSRGQYPLLRSARVSSGSHLVRVFKSGFEPFEQRVDVAGGSTAPLVVKLHPLERRGFIVVEEKGGHAVLVEIDGNVVGKAPWRGSLAPGAHVVLLRGAGAVGTPPVSVRVEAEQTLSLSLVAEALASGLRVEPVPVNAGVAIDKVTVGNGLWEGRLREGTHLIEVAAPGFLPETRRIEIARGARPTVRIELQRDPGSPFAPPASRWVLEGVTAAVVAPVLAGDVQRLCVSPCEGGPGLGGRAVVRLGYELSFRLGVGVEVGYLGLGYTAGMRRAALRKAAQPAEIVTVDDSLRIRSATLGLWAGFTLIPAADLRLHVRLGAGALVGSASNTRSTPTGTPRVEPTGERRPLFGMFLAPDIRLGVPLGGRFELLVGVELLGGLFPSPPQWSPDHLVVVAHDDGRRGFGTFSETFAGPLFGVCPGIGVRRDL